MNGMWKTNNFRVIGTKAYGICMVAYEQNYSISNSWTIPTNVFILHNSNYL